MEPADRLLPQVVDVIRKSAVFVPVIEIELMVNVAVPELLTVTLFVLELL